MRSAWVRSAKGLSPLARGNLPVSCRTAVLAGPIPARAGQPSEALMQSLRSWAYPRSRGATELSPMLAGRVGGLSPLARGNRTLAHAGRARRGPIPARAGQPWSVRGLRWKPWAYPRSRGATWCSTLARTLQTGLSPLARGNPTRALPLRPLRGPIPARAGQPARLLKASRAPRAYPRSRGATRYKVVPAHESMGLSPLARGNLRKHRTTARTRGPIPARAGQPRHFSSTP